MKRLGAVALTLGCLLVEAGGRDAGAEGSETYSDSQGRGIVFPLGATSFADQLVDYRVGQPRPKAKERRGENALGPPDFEKAGDGRATTLGCSGTLILRFDDNVLVDQPGDDLHIFEVGKDVEPTYVAISKDGSDWIDLGAIGGGTASLDIAGVADAGMAYRYVRLVDDGVDCKGRWPGADIDAVGAIGAAMLLQIPGSVLFDHDSSKLRADALAEIDRLTSSVDWAGRATLTIIGHTDSSGSDLYNQDLSLRRAESVRDYMSSQEALDGIQISVEGAGEKEPIASNLTETGRSENRRVEFIIR